MVRNYIIYGAQSGIVRRVITTDSSGFSIQDHLASSAEDWTLAPISTEPFDVVQVMQNTKGITPPPARCVLVHPSGDVINVLAADPAIDQPNIPAHGLYLHPLAGPGWRRRSSDGGFDPPAQSSNGVGSSHGSSNGGSSL